MRKTTKYFIAAVCAVTIASTVLAYRLRPAVSHAEVMAIAFLSVLAVVGELWAFVLAREAKGSIAYIPYLAAVLIVPSWVSIVAVIGVKIFTELRARVDPPKAVFNAFSHGLTQAIAIGVYLSVGGVSLLETSSHSLSVLTTQFGGAALLAIGVSFVANALVIGAVISIESGQPFLSTSRANHLANLGVDLLSAPIVFVFAWIYASFGAMAAAVAWFPIVGIRHVYSVNGELEKTNEELLQLMVKSIEVRDPYTSGHSRRVSKYAVAIARALGLSNREIKSVSTAALLHDVGKIYEKYAPILSKPGKLTPDEWTIMQEHPVDGANLVATISRMRDLVPAVRHHHENWDGTGYPDRIAGSLIPLASRIITFADTIDAMTSERPYRGALTEIEVRAELIRCRGKQFDPEIADRLLVVGIWRTLFGHSGSPRPQAVLTLVGAQTRDTA
jgi:putative nucleotidyltransferase with HDIG domain